MRVLFALNNEKLVNQLAEFYQSTYKKELETKQVYFFKSLIETLRREKGFDRIIIHEELEPTGTKNQDVIDNYLYNNLDEIKDEAGKADIIIICSEKRQVTDKLFVKLFNLGIYNILIGQERTAGNLSSLIERPRTRREAKEYLGLESQKNISADSVNKNKLDEIEIRNIQRYFTDNIGDRNRIVAAFNQLYEQYTFEDLKEIIIFLPLEARQILEQSSPNYIALMNWRPSQGNVEEKSLKTKVSLNLSEYFNRNKFVTSKAIKQEVSSTKPPVVEDVSSSKKTNIYNSNAVLQEEILKNNTEHKVNNYKEINSQNAYIVKDRNDVTTTSNFAKTSVDNAPIYKTQNLRTESDGVRIQTVTKVIEKEVIQEVCDIPKDYKKVTCFIGAHKVGTTFIINAIANNLANKGVKVAILDLTCSKDSYVIYASRKNDQKELAANSLNNLLIGQNRPLKLGNLSVYTGIPRTNRSKMDVYRAIEIVKRENAVVLVDCDFATMRDASDTFRYADSIYVVQDMDMLKILPITMFLKSLKNLGINNDKISVIINKYMRSAIKIDDIVESLSVYLSPDSKILDRGLLSETVKKIIVPFDEHNYLRYIENISCGKMEFSGFSENFNQAVSVIAQELFPIGTKGSLSNNDGLKYVKNMFGKF